MNKTDSTLIDILRLPLAIMVIYIHSVVWIREFDILSLNPDYPWTNAVGMLLAYTRKILCTVAVPTFFLISGYLFFKNFTEWNTSTWLNKMKSRVYTILIPYLLWNLFYIVVDMFGSGNIASLTDVHHWIVEQGGLSMFWDSCFMGTSVDFWERTWESTGPYMAVLWFLRDLMVALLFTPLFFWLFSSKQHAIIRYFGLGVLSFFFLFRTYMGIHGLGMTSLFYVGLGAYLMLNKQHLSLCFYPYRYIAGIFSIIIFGIAAWIMTVDERVYFIMPLYTLFAVITTINIASYFARRAQAQDTPIRWWSPRRWKDATFFIYVAHIFVQRNIFPFFAFAIYHLYHESWFFDIPFVNTHPILISGLFVVLAPTTAIVCIAIYQFLVRFLPRLTAILTGKR